MHATCAQLGVNSETQPGMSQAETDMQMRPRRSRLATWEIPTESCVEQHLEQALPCADLHRSDGDGRGGPLQDQTPTLPNNLQRRSHRQQHRLMPLLKSSEIARWPPWWTGA